MGRKRSCCHDSRHSASKTNDHRHKASSRKTNLPKQLVHHKSNPGDVAAVLQYGQEEEQHHDKRQEGKHASHTAEEIQAALDQAKLAAESVLSATSVEEFDKMISELEIYAVAEGETADNQASAGGQSGSTLLELYWTEEA